MKRKFYATCFIKAQKEHGTIMSYRDGEQTLESEDTDTKYDLLFDPYGFMEGIKQECEKEGLENVEVTVINVVEIAV